MDALISTVPAWLARLRPALPKRGQAAWRALAALGTAVCFAFLLTAAASHHHASGLEAHACLVCGVLSDELPTPTVPARAAPSLARLLYRVLVPSFYRYRSRATRLLPPSCGPPDLA